MGCSRSGLTSRIHTLVDTEGRPIALKLTAGQAHDSKAAASLLQSVSTYDIILADKAFEIMKICQLA